MSATGESETRLSRVQDVVDACIRRRVAGENLPDAQLVREHADLMPELGTALHKLALIERAERSARDSSSDASRLSGTPLPPADAFPGYEVIGEVHRGGQGVVYQAVQHRTQRSVAIKVMHGDPRLRLDSAARFEREIQVLGQLDHPNVLTIHDTGSTDDTSYYVTDYIRGEPLVEFVASRELSIRDVLRIFVKVCDAVGAAHLRGVIHRDLKPGNILVDREGEPRVLDFGLAKLVRDEPDQNTVTSPGQFVGSLPWASPEQAAGALPEMDTRTDVYSLGVLLYQSLTGRFPYAVTGRMPDVVENIVSAEPVRPSAVRVLIDDEVETIVLKCLSKEPERRYQTAGELGRDIRHYLAGEPIEAKRDSVGYMLRKQLRRHRLPVGISVAFVFTVTAGLVVSLVLWQDAEQGRAEAERQAAIAQAVVEFLNEDLLAAADPEYTADRDITVAEVLDAAAGTVESRFADEPLVEAAVRRTLGTTYRNLGKYDAAEPHLLRALELRVAELGVDHHDTLRSSHDLAWLRVMQGRFEEAEQPLLDVLATRRGGLGDNHHDTLSSMAALASLYQRQGRLADAEKLGLETLAAQRQTLGNEHRDTLVTLASLALLYREQGRLDEAEPLFTEVLEASRRVFGDEHSHTLTCMHNLALVLRDTGRWTEAERLLTDELAVCRRVLGAEHPKTLISMTNLARTYRSGGRYDEAEALYTEALEAQQRVLGDSHPYTLSTLCSLAVLYEYQGRLDEAEPMMIEAVARYRESLGDRHPHTIKSIYNLGGFYQEHGRHAEAEPLLREAYEGRCEVYGPENGRTLIVLHVWAKTLIALDRLDDAESAARELLTRVRETPDAPTFSIVKAINFMADVLLRQSDRQAAEALLREALDVHLPVMEGHGLLAAETKRLLGVCLTVAGEYAEAERLLGESRDLLIELEAEPALLQQVHQHLAELLEASRRPDQDTFLQSDQWSPKK